MKIWVRSQDKTRLVPSGPFNVEKEEYIKDELPFVICTYYEDYKIRLGHYKTKERALEVLDEIQGKITQNECLKLMISKLSNVKGEEEKIGKLFKEMIYEMPIE